MKPIVCLSKVLAFTSNYVVRGVLGKTYIPRTGRPHS